jgi:hypothetical protein
MHHSPRAIQDSRFTIYHSPSAIVGDNIGERNPFEVIKQAGIRTLSLSLCHVLHTSIRQRLDSRNLSLLLLGAIFVFSVSLWWWTLLVDDSSTTETQRTLRLHRELLASLQRSRIADSALRIPKPAIVTPRLTQ